MELEKKLKNYRAKKRREEFTENVIARFKKAMSVLLGNTGTVEPKAHVINIEVSDKEVENEKQIPEISKPKAESQHRKHTKRKQASPQVVSSEEESLVSDDDEEELEDTVKTRTWIDYVTWLVYFLFWATLYAIAVKLKFGAVYFILSCFVGMYLNTRTGRKRRDEVSAYSVFNPNVESIDGTLKAEQLERQFGIRA